MADMKEKLEKLQTGRFRFNTGRVVTRRDGTCTSAR